MRFKLEVNRMLMLKKHDETVAKICKKFGISISHAEEIIRNINDYQWYIVRMPKVDEKVRKLLEEKDIVKAVKAVKKVKPDWGLMGCKLYVEDVRDKRKSWPAPVEVSEEDE